MIKIIDTLNNKELKTMFVDIETFKRESWYKQKEQFALLTTLDTGLPINHIPEIFGLKLISQ